MEAATPSHRVAVTITSWNACYNSGEGIISLSCTATAKGGGISGIGLMLNNSAGETLASIYVELSEDCASVTPAINIQPGALKVGDRVSGVASGEAGGKHFFFQERLTIGNC